MKSIVPIFLCLLCIATRVVGQSHLSLNVDLAAFQYEYDKAFVEMYYSFPRSTLAYTPTTNGYEGAVLVNASIRNALHESTPLVRVWRVPVTVTDTLKNQDQLMIGKSEFVLEPGKYRFLIVARDEQDAHKVDSIELLYEVRSFPLRATSFSDIELCTSLRQIPADTANIFYKNTLEVIPNPPRLYGKSSPSLIYYSELYHADLNSYIVTSEIVSSYGKTMTSRSQPKVSTYDSRVEIGSLNIVGLPSGVYTLILSYSDTGGVVLASQSKQFYLFNPDVAVDTASIKQIASAIAFEFTTMAEDQLDEQFAMAKYIATSEEQAIWEGMRDAESKKKFLTKFWNGRDSNPDTPGNEAYDNYMQRVATANEQFHTAYRPGWKTDRGRVFLLYGPPDYIERHNGDSDGKPYDTWRYDTIQSGVDFIFVDKGGFNEYQLVHSTMRNELNNPDWQHLLK